MRADGAPVDHHAARMDEQDLIDLLELQRLTRELRDHLTTMFSVEGRRTYCGRWQRRSSREVQRSRCARHIAVEDRELGSIALRPSIW